MRHRSFCLVLILFVAVVRSFADDSTASGKASKVEHPSSRSGVNEQAAPVGDPVGAAITHLAAEMDKFHSTFHVYTDAAAAGNHFVMLAEIVGEDGGGDSIMDPESTKSPLAGATCIKCTFIDSNPDDDPDNWGGFYLMNGVLDGANTAPEANWGQICEAGLDLSGATTLSFWARGETGREKIEFFAGGVGWGDPTAICPDSSPRHPEDEVFRLSSEWQRFAIPVGELDLGYVLGGFGWVANDDLNPGGATFYLDDIQYDKPRLEESRFVVSYDTLPVDEDFDEVMRNVAFTYDNAIAALAFIARGTNDDWRRAELICNALVYASENDRFYIDGGLRNAYQAGDLILPPGWNANDIPCTVRMPGFLLDGIWNEDQFQVSRHTGNSAWPIIALLTFNEAKERPSYVAAATKMGEWISLFGDAYQGSGFRGGFEGWEPDPTEVQWASTEHNLDLAVAFTMLADATGDVRWEQHAASASDFVEAMWRDCCEGEDCGLGCDLDCGLECGFFRPGTLNPDSLNDGVLALDPQSWAFLAMPELLELHPNLLESTQCLLGAACPGFEGFDFGLDLSACEAPDGVWFEGTAQMVVALRVAGQDELAAFYLEQLEAAQATARNGNGQGIVAACPDGITTGFTDGFGNLQQYFARLHVAATGWFVFAELNKNPYDLSPRVGDLDGDGVTGSSDLITLLGDWGVCREDRATLCPGPVFCPSDLDGDGVVGTGDLILLLGGWS